MASCPRNMKLESHIFWKLQWIIKKFRIFHNHKKYLTNWRITVKAAMILQIPKYTRRYLTTWSSENGTKVGTLFNIQRRIVVKFQIYFNSEYLKKLRLGDFEFVWWTEDFSQSNDKLNWSGLSPLNLCLSNVHCFSGVGDEVTNFEEPN
jgi:hypothetical protein